MGLIIGRVTTVEAVQAQSDWDFRSGLDNITLAENFATDASVKDQIFGERTNGTGAVGYDDINRTTADGLSGGGCLRIDEPASDASDGRSWFQSLMPTEAAGGWTGFEAGDRFYFQFALKFPANRLGRDWGGDGFKTIIISEYDWSNPDSSQSLQEFENVQSNSDYRDQPEWYHSGSPGFHEDDYPAASDINLLNGIDLGTGITNENRYCIFGTSRAGCRSYVSDEWMWFQIRIEFGTNYNGCRSTMWYATESDTHWQMILDFGPSSGETNWDPSPGSELMNGFWLLPFDTNRTANFPGNVDTYHLYDECLSSGDTSTTNGRWIPKPKLGGAPSWLTSQNYQEWFTIPSAGTFAAANIYEGQADNENTIFDSWNGAVVDQDQRELIFPANGGHNDSDDNAVYGLNLGTETPAWRVLASQGTNRTPNSSTGICTDNTPSSDHTNGLIAYDESMACVVRPYFSSMALSSGPSADYCFTWHRTGWADTRGWNTSYPGANNMTSDPDGSNTQTLGAAAFDPVTAKVWFSPDYDVAGGQGVWAIDSSPRAETRVQEFTAVHSDAGSSYGTAACAGAYGLYAHLRSTGQLTVYDTVAQGSGWVFEGIPTSNPSLGNAPSIMWHEASDAFLVYPNSGTTVYTLRPTSWASPGTGWSYTSYSAGAGTATPTGEYTANGVGGFHKCDIVHNMGNGEAMLITVQRETAQPMGYRLRTTGIQ